MIRRLSRTPGSCGRVYFPFGRPEGALKATLALLECVLHKDMVMPPSQDEVRGVIKKCLENAALVNYTKLSADTRIEGGCLRLVRVGWRRGGGVCCAAVSW